MYTKANFPQRLRLKDLFLTCLTGKCIVKVCHFQNHHKTCYFHEIRECVFKHFPQLSHLKDLFLLSSEDMYKQRLIFSTNITSQRYINKLIWHGCWKAIPFSMSTLFQHISIIKSSSIMVSTLFLYISIAKKGSTFYLHYGVRLILAYFNSLR